jgi:hypothetical protein
LADVALDAILRTDIAVAVNHVDVLRAANLSIARSGPARILEIVILLTLGVGKLGQVHPVVATNATNNLGFCSLADEAGASHFTE